MIEESTLARLAKGDTTVVDSVINEHLSLAKKIAHVFARMHPGRHDDIRGVAYLGLVKAVHDIHAGVLRTDKAKTYINNTIRGHIKHFIQKDHLIPIPNWYFSQNIEDIDQNIIPIIYGLDARDESDEENHEEEASTLTFDAPAPERGDEEVVNEFYLELTNFERVVLDLRAEDYTYKEIGDKVGKSDVWILKTLNSIKDKFLRERVHNGR